MNTVVEQPKPIDIEQPEPIKIQRPIKYIEKVNIPHPVDGKGSESTLNTNVNNINDVNSVSPSPVDGLQDLSSGYTPHKIQKKA